MSSIEDRINHDILQNGVEVTAPVTAEHAEVLSAGALRFVAALSREFEAARSDILRQREMRRREIQDGIYPDFIEDSRHIRDANWSAASPSRDLIQRTVEIVCPAGTGCMTAAIASGADVVIVDFEDTASPIWENLLQGQRDLADTINTIDPLQDETAKTRRLAGPTPAVAIRPRGWHLDEKHVIVDGGPVPAALFDFGVFFYNNARALIGCGAAPHLYVPKLEGRYEARLWNDVFNMAQDALGISRGTIRATILVETVFAAFEMDEMLFELRHHASGLACGHWDYLFSFVETFQNDCKFVLPDRQQVHMDRHFLSSFADLLIHTAHRRGVHAIGGMAIQIPIDSDPLANAAAMHGFREDKIREAKSGHDGTWVTHPELVSPARAVWSAYMEAPNQIDRKTDRIRVAADDLLVAPAGEITETGLRSNINVGIIYLESWLRGCGCVAVYNRVETAATADVARAQIWQWIRHHAVLQDGRVVTADLVRQIIEEELQRKREGLGEPQYKSRKFDLAASLLDRLTTDGDLEEPMTLVAYEHLQ